MKLGHVSVAKLATLTLLMVAMVVASGCGSLGGDQNTFNPAGDVAQKQLDLFILVLIPAVIILIAVTAVLFFVLFRYRRRDGDGIPEQIHGNNALEIGWTIAPAVLMIAIAIPTVIAIFDLGGEPAEDALHVRVVAFQWDWRFEYLDPEYLDEDGDSFVTDDLYIPLEREVFVELQALDVIHSFWIPKLAGKKDVMPGRINTLKFNATETGVFLGQCAEFCGIGHTIMKFTTTALEPAQFESCLETIAQEGESPLPTACVP